MFLFIFIISLIALLIAGLMFSEWFKNKKFSPLRLKTLENKTERLASRGDIKNILRLLSPYSKELLSYKSNNNKLLYQYLEALIKDDQLSKCLDIIESREKLYPNNLKLQRLKSQALFQQKNYPDSLDTLLKCKAVLRNNDDKTQLAELYYHTQNYDKSIELLKETLAKDALAKNLALLGDCYFRKENFSEALVFYRKATQKGLIKKQILNQMGHSLRHMKEYDKAIDLFNEILSKDSHCTSSTLGLGACLEALGEYHHALNLYRKSSLWKSKDPIALRQAGVCCLHLKRYRFAEIYLQKSINKGQESLQSYLFLTSSLERQKKWQEAESIYFKLINLFPEHVSGYRGLAWLFGVGLGSNIDSTTGISMAKKSLNLLNNAVSWEILSACEARAGNFLEAHHIQECLSSQNEDRDTRKRRQLAMRSLRKKIPLNGSLVSHNLVA
jgi:tetratricopeptide (TPR) repeat protein